MRSLRPDGSTLVFDLAPARRSLRSCISQFFTCSTHHPCPHSGVQCDLWASCAHLLSSTRERSWHYEEWCFGPEAPSPGFSPNTNVHSPWVSNVYERVGLLVCRSAKRLPLSNKQRGNSRCHHISVIFIRVWATNISRNRVLQSS